MLSASFSALARLHGVSLRAAGDFVVIHQLLGLLLGAEDDLVGAGVRVLNDRVGILLRLLADLLVVSVRVGLDLLLELLGLLHRRGVDFVGLVGGSVRLGFRFAEDLLLLLQNRLRLHHGVRQHDAELADQVDQFPRVHDAQGFGHRHPARVVDARLQLIDHPPRLSDAVRRGRASVFAAHGALLLLPLIHLILLHIRIGSAISALIVHIQSLVYMLKVGCSYA